MSEKIYGDTLLENGLLGTETLKKIQEELTKNKNKQVTLIDMKLYRAKSAREKKKRDLKSADMISIKETLNKIYKEYHRKMSTKKITTLEEFEGIILIGLALFDALDSYSLDSEEDKVAKYKGYLEEYRILKAKRAQYSKYARKYASVKEIEGFDLELKENESKIKELEKKLNDFTKTHFTKVFQDYNEFKAFLNEDEVSEDIRGRTLKMLAELSTLNSYIDKLPEEEEEDNVILKLETYLDNIKEIDLGKNVGKESLVDSISDIMSELEDNGNTINIALHLAWANILIRHNIMRYAAIAEDYKNSRVVKEIKSLRHALIDYYNNTLTYENEIPVKIEEPERKIIKGIGRPKNTFEDEGAIKKITPSVTEKHYDDLFYDLLALNRNNKCRETLKDGESMEEIKYKTFHRLKSTKPSIDLGEKFGNIKIDEKTGNVNINCSFEDFVLISNALQAAEVLSEEESYKKVTNFFESDAEWYQNKKFKLKSRYDTEFDNFGIIMDEALEIKKTLEEKGEKLNFLDLKVLYYLLFSLNQTNEERVRAGLLLQERDFFGFTVRELLKSVETKEKNNIEENGVLSSKKLEKDMEEENNFENFSLYYKKQEIIINEIRNFIVNSESFILEMNDLGIKELSTFENFLKNIKNFDFYKTNELKEIFQEEPDKFDYYIEAQKEFIRKISGNFFLQNVSKETNVEEVEVDNEKL